MGVTNRDSSVLTMKRRGVAERSYYEQWKAATVNNANPQQGLSAPAKVSAEVVSEIALGCAVCTGIDAMNNKTDPNIGVFNPSSGGAGRGF